MDGGQRIDKWLFFARFFKSRSLAAAVAQSGETRLNGVVVAKAAHPVRPGDRLDFMTGPRRRAVLVIALGGTRRPAPEARLLYQEIPPEDAPARHPVAKSVVRKL